MEIIVELLFEFLVQVIGEVLFELGFHSLAEPFRRPPDPWLAALGYTIFGALFGAISLLVLPSLLAGNPVLRWANLIITPIAVGLCMSCIGVWRAKRGRRILRIDRFSYGYLFALAFALVRFTWAS